MERVCWFFDNRLVKTIKKKMSALNLTLYWNSRHFSNRMLEIWKISNILDIYMNFESFY